MGRDLPLSLQGAKPVKRRFFLFWHHGCSAARNSPACKGKSLRCLRKCRFLYTDTSPALSARRHLRAALRYSACPPHRPSCLDLGCQTHQTWRAPRHLGAASSPNWSPVQNFCRELRLQSFGAWHASGRRWNRMRGWCVAVAQVVKV